MQDERIRLLVLGGTRFLGRALVDAALARGPEPTLFNRGQTNPGLFPEVEQIQGDRTVDLSPLEGRSWDAVLDVATYLPRVVRRSVEALERRVGTYVYISSISAYADQSTPPVEGAPVAELDDRAAEDLEQRVPSDTLVAAGVGEWMELPLWIVTPEYSATHLTDVSKAKGVGLRFRPLAETIADTLAWDEAREVPRADGVGLTPERERELLAHA